MSRLYPQIIAHRGASGYQPENTLAAVELAHRQGADWIECDVVLTKDNEVLVLHDLELDYVTDVVERFPGRAREDGRHYVIDFTWEEIRSLRSRTRLKHDLSGPLYAGRFETEPTPQPPVRLEEWIETIQNLNRESGREAGICVELKGPVYHAKAGRDLPKRVAGVLEKYGYNRTMARGMVMSFEPAVLRAMRQELDWQSPMLQLVGEPEWGESEFDYGRLLTPLGLEEIAQYATWVGVHLPQAITLEANQPPRSTGLVERAQECGLRVASYTFQHEGLPEGHILADVLDFAIGELGMEMPICDFPDEGMAAVQRLREAKR